MSYITDLPYSEGYCPEQSPLSLAFVAWLNGVRGPDLSGAFTYCDLGCGQGTSLNAFAAALPEARFIGIDLSEAHIASARATATAAKLENVEYRCADLAELDLDTLPELQIVAAHGLYSWVPESCRSGVRRLIRARLCEGSLAYISTNAMPGWGPLMPLRDLMLSASSEGQGSAERASRGVALLKELREAGAALFKASRAAYNMVDQLLESDLSYVAHEFFNPSWKAFYFPEIVSELETCGLHFIGSQPLHMNEFSLTVPTQFHALFAASESRVESEVHRDFVRGETFRQDVFIKGAAASASVEDLASWRFGTTTRRSDLTKKKTFRHCEVELSSPVFAPLAGALSLGSGTPKELEELAPVLAEVPSEDRLDALLLLVFAGRAMPFARSSRVHRAPSGFQRCTMPLEYNRQQLARSLWTRPQVLLSSPVAGTGIELPFLDALVIEGLCQVGVSGFVEWAKATLAEKERGPKLLERGALEQLLAAFLAERLWPLVALELLSVS